MLFNSAEFILIFLPLAYGGFVLSSRGGTTLPSILWLVAASLGFYAWWNWHLLGLLAGSICGNYLLGLLFVRRREKALLITAIAANLLALAWFKYCNFFIGTANTAFGLDLPLMEVVLPLAISFFTFQQIAYLVDVQRGSAPASSFAQYCLFVTFFPHLVAGPLLHHADILPQFARGAGLRPRWENASVGLSIFAVGLFKKGVIADNMKEFVDIAFGAAANGQTVTFVTAWVCAGAYALQIYFDFSGYSDMAIGIARLFGIKLPINFDSPYRANSITEFWRRWHITLSRFLRDYLYIPLGGNRSGESRRIVNLMTVMLLGGLWHGAAWTFVVWGGLHGLFLVAHHTWNRLGGRMHWLPGRLLTLAAVTVAWVFFRADSFDSALIILSGMAGQSGMILPQSLAERLGPIATLLGHAGWQFAIPVDAGSYPTLSRIGMVALAVAATQLLPNSQQWLAAGQPAFNQSTAPAPPLRLVWRPTLPWAVATAIMFLIGLGNIYGQAQSFIYFTF
jgi:alginate O-acetyltransferase complex protein AlgI